MVMNRTNVLVGGIDPKIGIIKNKSMKTDVPTYWQGYEHDSVTVLDFPMYFRKGGSIRAYAILLGYFETLYNSLTQNE